MQALSGEHKALLLGVVGRGLALYPTVRFHYFVAEADHYHLLITPPDVATMSRFMNHVNSNIAKELRRANGLTGVVWARRYRAIALVDSDALARALRHLVEHDRSAGPDESGQLPRSSCLRALLTGEPVAGKWFDHTREYRTGRRKRIPQPAPEQFVQPYEFAMDPLPGLSEFLPQATEPRSEAEPAPASSDQSLADAS